MPDTPSGPWIRHTRTTVYENAWITVHHDEVTRPDGAPGIYGVVAFKNRAVGAVVVDDVGRILLVGQHRYTLDAYSWEVPEGGSPSGESPLAGAQRELAEETGLAADVWEVLVWFHTSNSVSDEGGVLYLARGLHQGEATPEGTERIEIRWVTVDEAVAMVDVGEITDAMSQIGILRYALSLAAPAAESGDAAPADAATADAAEAAS